MEIKKIKNKIIMQNEYVKLIEKNDTLNSYRFEALRDFELHGEKIKKGCISGMIFFKGLSLKQVEFIDKIWVSSNSCVEFTGKSKIENTYLNSSVGEIKIRRSNIFNTYIEFMRERWWYPSSNVIINCSSITNSKFSLTAALTNEDTKILINSSKIDNCNICSSEIPTKRMKVTSLLDIENSIMNNISMGDDVSVKNSRINDDCYAKIVIIDGQLFVEKSKLKFTNETSYLNFPVKGYYEMPYFVGNETLEKYSTFWIPRLGNNLCVHTSNELDQQYFENNRNPDLRESYKIFQKSVNKDKQNNDNTTNSVEKVNLVDASNSLIVEPNSNNNMLNSDNATVDIDTERNNRLEEVKKRARELGIEL